MTTTIDSPTASTLRPLVISRTFPVSRDWVFTAWSTAEHIKRGFCPTCGCFLFWKAHAEEGMSFSLGVIDGRPTGLELQKQIFVADKGDYYKIADNVPQREQ